MTWHWIHDLCQIHNDSSKNIGYLGYWADVRFIDCGYCNYAQFRWIRGLKIWDKGDKAEAFEATDSDHGFWFICLINTELKDESIFDWNFPAMSTKVLSVAIKNQLHENSLTILINFPHLVYLAFDCFLYLFIALHDFYFICLLNVFLLTQ